MIPDTRYQRPEVRRRRPRHTPPRLKLPVHLGTTILDTAREKFAGNEAIVACRLKNSKAHIFFWPESEANTRHRPQGAHTYGNTRRRSEPLVTILFQARVGNRQRSSSARVIQGPRGEGTFPHLEGLAGPLSRRWQQDGQLHEMRPRSFPGSDKTAQLRPSPTAVFCRTPVRAQIRSPRPPSRGPRGARNQHTIRCEGRLTESPLVMFVSVAGCSVASSLFRCR